MRRNQKRNIIIAIVLVILIIIGIGTFYVLTNKKEIEPVVEPKKEKYKVNKVENQKNLTFEFINPASNVVEHTIILEEVEDANLYDVKQVGSSKGDYYIITINAVKEDYYRVYNKDFQKISEDLFDENNQIKTYDNYEILSNGNIKLTNLEWTSENKTDNYSSGNGYVTFYEYIFNQSGDVVSQNSYVANYVIPMSHPFAFDSDYIYIFGNHGELLAKESIIKTSDDSYTSYICTPEENEEVMGHFEESEWIHFGNRGANAKKYVYNYQTGKLTIEDSKCMVE